MAWNHFQEPRDIQNAALTCREWAKYIRRYVR